MKGHKGRQPLGEPEPAQADGHAIRDGQNAGADSRGRRSAPLRMSGLSRLTPHTAPLRACMRLGDASHGPPIRNKSACPIIRPRGRTSADTHRLNDLSSKWLTHPSLFVIQMPPPSQFICHSIANAHDASKWGDAKLCKFMTLYTINAKSAFSFAFIAATSTLE